MYKQGKVKYLMYLIPVFIIILLGISISYSRFQESFSLTGSIVVPEENFCLNSGLSKLSDCILVMENPSLLSSVDAAKSYISSKQSAKLSEMAPSMNYQMQTQQKSSTSGVITGNAHFSLASTYTFDTKTGMFTLGSGVKEDVIKEEYVNYYTCGNTTGTYRTCATLYQILKWDKSGVTYRITEANVLSYKRVGSIDSQIGLYATTDDYGTSYFYRGNVKNNYVKFAGYVWRIIRENGDGSVRMIYSGTSTSATGAATSIDNSTSQFNSKYWDPTYVGYMFNEDFQLDQTDTTKANYINFSENLTYYYGSDYTFDQSSGKFYLRDTISGTWGSTYQEALKNHPYTCFGTSATGACNWMFKLVGYSGTSSAYVYYIGYHSKSYQGATTNTTDSVIKTKIENWYASHILNHTDENSRNYQDYISDEIFCGDRSLATDTPSYAKQGFGLSNHTFYGPRYRVYSTKTASLTCPNKNDKFTNNDTTRGNGKLKYPIGLLTIDEASLAGGLFNAVNTDYYLYTGQTYWTMSPCYFNTSSADAHVWGVNSTGALNDYWTTSSSGVRPVINLKSDVLITSGDGSASL